MAAVAKPWFADGTLQFDRAQPFFYRTGDFPWVAEVESQWEVIRDELMASLSEDSAALIPYVNREMTSRPGNWKTLGLMFWSVPSAENRRRFPRTWDIVSRVPHVTAASLNMLEGDTTIKPHVGNTDAIIRCHMGLVVPAPAPKCGFRVGDETRSWEEGKFLMFCDAHEHTAWNNTDSRRYILVIDVMRQEFVPLAASVSSRVLASIYHEAAYQRSAWLRRWLGGPRRQAFTLSLARVWYRVVLALKGKT